MRNIKSYIIFTGLLIAVFSAAIFVFLPTVSAQKQIFKKTSGEAVPQNTETADLTDSAAVPPEQNALSPGLTLYGITTTNQLVSFDASTPRALSNLGTVTGLQAGETILGIDVRPATGQLYGLGSASRLYNINPATAVATPVGAAGAFTLTGTKFGFDFNPTVDRIRVVSDADQDLRLNPNNGTLVATDGTLAYAGADANAGANPNIVEVAYTNSFNGSTATTLYDIDSALDILTIQNPPNSGTLNTIGPLGFNTSSNVGFDISSSGGTNTGYVSLANGGGSSLYTIDLTTGAVTGVAGIGSGTTTLIGLAAKIQAVSNFTAYGVNTSNQLVSFSVTNPGTVNTIGTITGVQGGEQILGIDFRPATGQLFGLGSGSNLYTINLTTAAATQVGVSGAFTLNGTNFGFDFNPTVDRIRIVSDAGQNIRLNPNDGTLTATDGTLSGAATQADAAAYTNSFSGSTVTTLYDLNAVTDTLYVQNPPNSGTLTTVGTGLGIGDFTAASGFDIVTVGTANNAYAALTVGGVSALYTVNLAAGTASTAGTIGAGTPLRGLAVQVAPVSSLFAYGVNASNQLVSFDTANPTAVTTIATISGLQGGDTILGIDFRPATGQLYGLGSGSRLYTINVSTAAATQVGASGAFTLSGTNFGFDFNPTVDRIRVVSDAGQNIRLNPNDGTLTATDGTLSGAAAQADAAAYTNSFGGSTATTLYDLNAATDTLYVQNPPNSGTLTAVGTGLGIGDFTAAGGFDIVTPLNSPGNNTAYAALTVGATASLYTIDLTAGTATLVGPIGGGAANALRGFAVQAQAIPTAATTSITGRVFSETGKGLSNVRITLTDMGGNTTVCLTNVFGYYKFTEVRAGNYVVNAQAKQYTFSDPNQFVSLTEEGTGIDFHAVR